MFNLLQFQGWIPFTQFSCVNHENLINWFFHHFDWRAIRNGDEIDAVISIQHGGREFTFGPDDWMDMLGLECQGMTQYKDTIWPREITVSREAVVRELNNVEAHRVPPIVTYGDFRYLSGDDKCLVNIIKRVILPTGNNDNRLVKLQERVLYCVRNTIRVNLPVLICSHIEYACQYKISSTLPYCGLISAIMLRWNVIAPGPGEEIISVIDEATLNRQGLVKVGARLICGWEAENLEGVELADYEAAAGIGIEEPEDEAPAATAPAHPDLDQD